MCIHLGNPGDRLVSVTMTTASRAWQSLVHSNCQVWTPEQKHGAVLQYTELKHTIMQPSLDRQTWHDNIWLQATPSFLSPQSQSVFYGINTAIVGEIIKHLWARDEGGGRNEWRRGISGEKQESRSQMLWWNTQKASASLPRLFHQADVPMKQ